MAFREQQHVSQPRTEPPRRIFFDDAGYFGLVVWYQAPDFAEITGFQLGYKPSPFNTDDEYLLTLRPQRQAGESIEASRTSPADRMGSAIKQLIPAAGPPPAGLVTGLAAAAQTLPDGIREFLIRNLNPWLSSRVGS